MFRDSSDGIEEYTTSVTIFINKCIEDVVPTVTVRTYTNQKSWITGNVRTELKCRCSKTFDRQCRWVKKAGIEYPFEHGEVINDIQDGV